MSNIFENWKCYHYYLLRSAELHLEFRAKNLVLVLIINSDN